jgi:pyruvate,water dikinase
MCNSKIEVEMPARFFQGAPVASGTIRGRAKIVHDWRKDFSFDPNTVVIVRFPVPKLLPMLTRAAALLCAYGSPNSFLANAARARGIPAVFKLGASLDAVADGAWVCVDGATGQVVCE